MQKLATIYRALADETRIHILALLMHNRELCVCDIMHVLDTTHSKASRHLRYLHHAGLVHSRRATVWMYYSIPKNLAKEQRAIIESLEKLIPDETVSQLQNELAAWLQQKHNDSMKIDSEAAEKRS